MLFEINDSIYSRQNTIGVRLEDLKNKPTKMISSMQMDGYWESQSLYEMTAQGKNGGVIEVVKTI